MGAAVRPTPPRRPGCCLPGHLGPASPRPRFRSGARGGRGQKYRPKLDSGKPTDRHPGQTRRRAAWVGGTQTSGAWQTPGTWATAHDTAQPAWMRPDVLVWACALTPAWVWLMVVAGSGKLALTADGLRFWAARPLSRRHPPEKTTPPAAFNRRRRPYISRRSGPGEAWGVGAGLSLERFQSRFSRASFLGGGGRAPRLFHPRPTSI